MPHVTVNFPILDFEIGNCGFKFRVPVDQPLAAIDQAVIIKLDENLLDGL